MAEKFSKDDGEDTNGKVKMCIRLSKVEKLFNPRDSIWGPVTQTQTGSELARHCNVIASEASPVTGDKLVYISIHFDSTYVK